MGWIISNTNNIVTFQHLTNDVTDQVYALSQGQYYISLLSGGTTINIKSAAASGSNIDGFNLSIVISDITTIDEAEPQADVVDLIAQLVSVMPEIISADSGGLTLSSTLAGLNIPSPGEPITSGSSILDAFANLQAQINDLNA